MNFRVECPHCKWGHPIKTSNINQGYLKAYCLHCNKKFFYKVMVKGVEVDFIKELPEDIPCGPEIK